MYVFCSAILRNLLDVTKSLEGRWPQHLSFVEEDMSHG